MHIVFDLDETLYETKKFFKQTIKDWCPNLDLDLDVFYKTFKEEGNKLFPLSQDGTISMSKMHQLRIINTMKRFKKDISVEEANQFDTLYYKNKKKISLEPEVIGTISTLKKRGHTLGIITNGEHTKQSNTIDYLNITDYIDKDNIIISGDLGMDKPNPAIFKHYETLMNKDHEYVYVGDHFTNDIVGSNNAGWYSIWYNPENKDSVNTNLIYFQIKSIPELLELPLLK